MIKDGGQDGLKRKNYRPQRIAGQNLHARLRNYKNLYIPLMNKDRLNYEGGMQAKLILPNCH